MMQMFAMMINAFYGGCGVGILNYFIFIIIAAFISGLMVVVHQNSWAERSKPGK